MHVEKTENAQIISVKLGEEHGRLSATLMLEGNGWRCGFGGRALDRCFAHPGEYIAYDGYGAMRIVKIGADIWNSIKTNIEKRTCSAITLWK